MRSALDPLPRSLSIRSLAILVTILVAGVAISVREYLESGQVHARDSAARSLSDEGRPCRRTGSVESAPVGTSFEIEPASAHSATACDRPVESDAPSPSAPGVWIPESGVSGS